MTTVLATVDAHVHIHPCYRPGTLFAHAFRNLSAQPAGGAWPRRFYLLLTECAADDAFGELGALARPAAAAQTPALEGWSLRATGEPISLEAHRNGAALTLVAGRQVACREGLEVLLIGTRERFADGRPIREVLEAGAARGLLRVIPWGPGKWLGRRGRLLSELLRDFAGPTLFLGDEGGRPGFWGYPAHFGSAARLGVRDLPGTDPLPFAHDVGKAGRMGFTLRLDLDPERPAASLLGALARADTPLQRFARLEPPWAFVRNQIGMQLRKRRA